MLGINFEKNSRPKNQERDYIKKEVETYEHPDNQDDFHSNIVEEDKLSVSSIRSAGFYDENHRLNIKRKIRNVMTMPPGPEKDQAFSQLKEGFIEQQKGIAILKDELFKEIGDGDHIDLEKINEIITENDKIYKFSLQQMSVIQSMTRDVLRRNQAVNDFYNNNFKNPNKIYQQLYNTEPNGKVELHKGPISLALICYDRDDYARMYVNDNSGRRNLGDQEKKDADATGGFFRLSSPINFPELKGTIIGVKRYDYSRVDETIDHEEQHALNNVYLNNIDTLRKDGLSSYLYFCNNKEQMSDVISSYCRYLVNDASNRAKDEILAYKVRDQKNNFITKTLTQNKTIGGIYDYFDYDKTIELIKNICQQGTLKQYQNELLNLAKKILKDEYEVLIKNGIVAVNNLKNKNYSQASIAAILMPQALENWPKAAERTKFCDFYSNSLNEIQNVVPSYQIRDLKDLKEDLPEE